MDLALTSFVQITGSTVEVHADSLAEAKLALKELKLKRKEYMLSKRSLTARQRAIRADYTTIVRSRGSMLRGGGKLGRFFRVLQTSSRDGRRAQLARDLLPLEREKQHIDALVQAIDSAVLQLEASILKHSS
jgi:hypothetical protein